MPNIARWAGFLPSVEMTRKSDALKCWAMLRKSAISTRVEYRIASHPHLHPELTCSNVITNCRIGFLTRTLQMAFYWARGNFAYFFENQHNANLLRISSFIVTAQACASLRQCPINDGFFTSSNIHIHTVEIFFCPISRISHCVRNDRSDCLSFRTSRASEKS